MKKLSLLFFLLGLVACDDCGKGGQSSDESEEVDGSPAMTMKEAVTYLTNRGIDVATRGSGTRVCVKPEVGGFEVTIEDVKAINALAKVVEIRVVASQGISPEVFSHFRDFPNVKRVVIHYQMPAGSIRQFDKFPNVEVLKFWGNRPVSCDSLPHLPGLKVFHYEGEQGEFSMASVKRIAACRSLEEVEILRPVREEGILLLQELPQLVFLMIEDAVIVDRAAEE